VVADQPDASTGLDVKRLQGHLTNTKQNSTNVTQQNEQSIYQIQTAAELSESGKLSLSSDTEILF